MLPRNVGTILLVVGTPLSMVGVMLPVVLLNTPILNLLLWQYDFWVFSLFNLINWFVCAVIFGDLRAVSCIICWLNTWLVISIDANTRTIGTLVRGATLWFPGVIFITVACSLHLLDVDEKHYEPLNFPGFDHHNLRVTLVNLFANISITISCYVGFRCYYKRVVLSQRFLTRRMVPSSIFRIGLALVPYEPKTEAVVRPRSLKKVASRRDSTKLSTQGSSSRLHVSISSSIWRSVRVLSDSNTSSQLITLGLSENHDIQPLLLIAPREGVFHASETLLPSLKTETTLTWSACVFLKTCWVCGHIFSTYGLTLRPFAPIASVVGLVLTSIYFGVVVAHCNRTMLRALLRNFDVIYVSFQGCASFISVGTSLEWLDWRMVALGTQILWLHLLIVMDALLPDARQRLGIRKRLFAPAMIGGVLFALFLLISILLGSELLMPRLENRIIFCLGSGSYCLHALSFLLMRFVSLLIVSFRLLWSLAIRPEGELLFFRGRVEFWAPYHLLPFEIATASGRIHTITPSDNYGR